MDALRRSGGAPHGSSKDALAPTKGVKSAPIGERAMYDDITECFWQRPQIARMLP